MVVGDDPGLAHGLGEQVVTSGVGHLDDFAGGNPVDDGRVGGRAGRRQHGAVHTQLIIGPQRISFESGAVDWALTKPP